ncbi:hypothetical protein O1611_g9848 [Lasiodiplodia mahajangana]|uniref:Uncharacterized protein n=1 Tax=Lasiodiplodia mahajangana TaxID=1108764 RepID=A0ACC2J4I6_9PEZI|nr:hypothetical protein O1611_g9848 [Lasiodiplodia mahajangana]
MESAQLHDRRRVGRRGAAVRWVAGDFYTNEYGTPLSMSVLLAGAPVLEGEDPKSELSAQGQDNLVVAGKLMVAARIAIVIVLWSLKMAVLDMLRPLLGKLQCGRQALWFIYLVLAFTFTASILSVFFECQELRLNWTLFPDAEQCAYDAAWITTYEISNIITDCMLFCLLLLLVISAPISKGERARLSTFMLSAVLIGVEGPKEDKGGSGKTDPEQGQVVVAGSSGGSKHGPPALQRIELWDSPIWDGMGLDSEDMTRKLVPRSSFHGSTHSSASAAAGNRDSWPRSIQSFRNVIRSPRPCSRLGWGTRTTDDDRPETLHKWIELEEIDARSVTRDATTPEPDDGGCRSGIFVATEINQEVHRIWDLDQRPRIITIPRRARLDRSQV